MATQIPNPIFHVYGEINEGKYKIVRHYELVDIINGIQYLPDIINISKDRSFAKSSPKYWLKFKTGKHFGKCETGLFKTKHNTIYFGDLNKRQHLLIFWFSDNADSIQILYYKDYFTTNLSKVLPLFNYNNIERKREVLNTSL